MLKMQLRTLNTDKLLINKANVLDLIYNSVIDSVV